MSRLSRWVRALTVVCGVAIAALGAELAHSANLGFAGNVGFSGSGSTVRITADAVQNLDATGQSGTIRLELWAFPSPYTGSQSGYKLAQYQLGPLLGGTQYTAVDSGPVPFTPPPDGTWYYTLFLTEYTGVSSNEGYTSRDFGNFPTPVTYGPVITLVEYYHSLFDHYFVTPVPAEIALLDAGQPPFQYWSRTGFSFDAYANAGAPAASVANCRFFNDHFAPKSSHFYAPRGFGCEATLSLFPDWYLEDGALFNTMLPDAAGNCPVGTVALYRLYNQGQGGAPNHRFVTSLSERQKMINQFWVPEGNGIGVGNCVPP